MKYLQDHWKSRFVIVMFVSVILSALMVLLELTDWAEHINQLGFSHGKGGEGAEGEKKNIPAIMMYILPFIKEFILIGVPMLLTLLWIKLFSKVKRLIKA